jgi:hypothetical protein
MTQMVGRELHFVSAARELELLERYHAGVDSKPNGVRIGSLRVPGDADAAMADPRRFHTTTSSFAVAATRLLRPAGTCCGQRCADQHPRERRRCRRDSSSPPTSSTRSRRSCWDSDWSGCPQNYRSGRRRGASCLRYVDRHVVTQLPVEVVPRHAENHLLPAVGVLERVGHVLAARVHVGHQVDELGVLQERDLRRRALPVRYPS